MGTEYKIDDLDRKILQKLEQNARLPLAAVGREIGLTAPAVAQRIQKMEQSGIIQSYQVKLDQKKLGCDLQAIITLKVGFGMIQAFKNALNDLPAIRECYRVTGDDCFVIKAYFAGNEQLTGFLDRLAEYGTTKTAIVLNDLLADKGA